MLIDSFYYLFAMFAQIPATFIIEFLGRKNCIILGNVLSCIYMVMIIFSQNIFNLIIAEILSATSFAIKESAEPSSLNESIPPTKQKSKIFAKINEKGMSKYYIINAISIIIAGILYEVNPYIPILLSLTTLIIVTCLAAFFIEPTKNTRKKKIETGNQLKELGEAFKFVLKSERIKSLILYSSIMAGLFSILCNYEISMMEELEISATYLGILFAILGIVAAISTKKQEKLHNRFKNKSLTVIGCLATVSCILAGVSGVIAKEYKIGILFIILFYVIRYVCSGIYHPLIEKYLSNFTNKDIDTKVFTANNLLKSVVSAFAGILASFLLDRMETAYCMVVIGFMFFLLIILVNKFMSSRVGLKPEEYPKEEVKYDKIK